MPFLGQSFNRQEGQTSTLLCEEGKLLNSFFVIFVFDTCWRPTTVKVPNGSRFFHYYFSTLWGTDRSQILFSYEVRQTPPTFFRRLPPRGWGGEQREMFAQQITYVMASLFVLE